MKMNSSNSLDTNDIYLIVADIEEHIASLFDPQPGSHDQENVQYAPCKCKNDGKLN
jgi:hypothetical protein